ncbi:Protein CBG12831, partial [Caenorhabditis briggsae]
TAEPGRCRYTWETPLYNRLVRSFGEHHSIQQFPSQIFVRKLLFNLQEHTRILSQPVFCFLFAEKLEKWPGDNCRKLEVEISVYSGDSTATFANRDSTASSPLPLGPSSKKTKADRSRSFDAVPANTMTAEENNITFN